MVSGELLCLLMVGVAMACLLAGFPVAFTLAGVALIFAGVGSLAGAFRWHDISAFPLNLFGLLENETLVAVPLFIFMGVMLERSKVAEELLDTMSRLFGGVPGGLAISVCLVGALLAASTGIVGATVVTMGLLSLPTMIRRGYDKPFACGSIAASGTLGQIIPPSIVLVLLGDQLSSAYQNAQRQMGIFAPDTVSVNELFAGAILPGLLLVGLYIVYQIFYVIAWPEAAPAVPVEGERPARREFWIAIAHSLFAPLALIVAVLGSILGGLATPTEAAGVGAIGATMLAGYRIDTRRGLPVLIGVLCMVGLLILATGFDLRAQRAIVSGGEKAAIGIAIVLTAGLGYGVLVAFRRTFAQIDDNSERMLASVAQSTMVITAMIFVIIIGARMFTTVFIGFEGDAAIQGFLQQLPGGTLTAMLTVMLVMFLLGFFLDFLEIMFIVVPIVAPVLLQLEMPDGSMMSPVWLGIMMAINLQTSFLTPPFGFALFYLRGVAPETIATMQIYRGVIPFVAIQVVVLILLWYLPAMATWLPRLLYPGIG